MGRWWWEERGGWVWLQISIGHCLVNGFHCGVGRVGVYDDERGRGITRWICRVLISRPHGKSGSAAAAQDVKRNYTGRQIYCGQPEMAGRTCWRMSRRWWRRRVCSHSRPGAPPLKQRSEGLMKCEIKLVRRCFSLSKTHHRPQRYFSFHHHRWLPLVPPVSSTNTV